MIAKLQDALLAGTIDRETSIRSVCQSDDQSVGDTRMIFLFQFMGTAFLYVAALVWIAIGYFFGQLVGVVVGGRFGPIASGGRAMVGALLGACKTGSFYVM